MIDADMRNAIYRLHQAGYPMRQISRQFKISRNTVRAIIRQQGAMPQTVRKDKIQIDPELLQRLYRQCDGWLQRVHEKLVEEEGVNVSYPTLTRLLRELGLGQSRKARCARVPDQPGVEMQHDTTVYQVRLSGRPTRLIASLLYLRYSKRRYLKFYRVFPRFAMKCFLHEALMFWGYSARQCIIDNTNLARLRGTGKQAVIVPEMASFAERYGFRFVCHEIGHANRKAGEERSFWTVETNFLPGRRFEDLPDLNQQAFQWATVRLYHRPVSKTGLIPAKAFEHERGYLSELPSALPAPYWAHQRGTDQYGYVPFQANYYWVPGSKRDSRPEEQRLRALGPDVETYLDYALKTPGIQRHRFLRELFALSRQLTPAVFVQTLQRARHYRIVQLETLRRIAWFCTSQGEHPLPQATVDENFRQRPAYQEGCLTDPPDLTRYDDPVLPDNHATGHDPTPETESEDSDG